MGQRASLWGGGWPHGRARAFEHAGGTAASGPRSSRVSPRPTVGASEPSMPLDLRRPSTPTMGMIANSAFTSRGRSSRGEPPAAAAAGAHLFSGLATASSGEAMSGAAREGRTAERLIGLAGAKPSAAPTASNMVGPGRIRQRAAVPRGANPANVHAATRFPPCGISLITPGNQHTPRLVSFGQGHPNVHWSMPPSLTLHDSLRTISSKPPRRHFQEKCPTVVEPQPGVGRSRVQGTSGALRQSAEDLQRCDNGCSVSY